jgi:hypothetical protein
MFFKKILLNQLKPFKLKILKELKFNQNKLKIKIFKKIYKNIYKIKK